MSDATVLGRRGMRGILPDYHTHPVRPPADLPAAGHLAHYREWMGHYAERAAALGLAELGFAEHIYYLTLAPGAVPWRPAGRGDIGAYVAAAQAVKEACARRSGAGRGAVPAIRLGLEVDIVPATVSILQAALPLYPFDYILGSVHRIPGVEESTTTEDAYRAYYAALRWAAGSGLFHAIAHPDRVHRRLPPADTRFLEEQMAETVDTLARHGLAAEVSAVGVRGGHAGIDPHPAFVRLCHARGVPITLGSDAHALEEVGTGLAQARDLVWAAGYRQVATFERGRRIDRPLEPPAPLPPGRRSELCP
jgi:histidinol-phosphatase (PHP family)